MTPMLIVSLLLLQNPNSTVAKIGIDQKLGAQVDPDIMLRDENGRMVKLREFFGAKPVLLTPVYFECPMLCSLELNGLVRALRVMRFAAGKEFEIVTFSFDPGEGPSLALAKKEQYLLDYDKPTAQAGWHFLTGDSETIAKLTNEIGFRYVRDETTRQWAHASALMVLTPEGKVSQYFYGIEPDPEDLKLSLIEASGGKIGSFVDRALLYCYQYDAHSGKYSLTIMRVLRIAGLATVMALVGFMVFAQKREGAQKAQNRTQKAQKANS
jgi:protein SCO1/2